MENTIIELTPRAIEQIKKIEQTDKTSPEQGIRFAVVGGGCSGFSYKIDFSDPKEKDFIFDFDGVKVLIDPKSSLYLKGVKVDFQDGLKGKGFVFENPSAKNTCGCGESFSV